jgi:hypothetical protein
MNPSLPLPSNYYSFWAIMLGYFFFLLMLLVL